MKQYIARNKQTGQQLCKFPLVRLNGLTKKHTAFGSFVDMLTAPGGYRPSFYAARRPMEAALEIIELADAYDDAQAVLRDSRRAFRGDFNELGEIRR